MVCRKILMACACHEQSKANQAVEDGKSFAYYVDYLANNVLTFPAAKAPIDAIRTIGNCNSPLAIPARCGTIKADVDVNLSDD